MHNPQSSWIIVLGFLVLNAQVVGQDDDRQEWRSWRGPGHRGQVAESTPPLTWSETENVVWKVALPGEGSSTPIVSGNQIFLTTATITDRAPSTPPELNPESMTVPPGTLVEFHLHCLDRKSGKTQWSRLLTEGAPHEGRHKSSTYAASSPVIDEDRIYIHLGSFGIFCLRRDGEPVWEKQLGRMRTRRGWGEAVSPALADGKLVIMWDQEDDSHIYCLDADDGALLWEQERNEPTTWATPLVLEHRNRWHVVTPGTNRIRAYDLQTGAVLWQSVGLTLNAIPSPVRHGNLVICMSGYRGNAAVAVDLESLPEPLPNDSVAQPEVVWKLTRDTPYVPSPLLTGNRLYFTKGLSAILTCVNADDGRPVYETRRLDGLKNMYASPVATEQHVFLVSREGVTLVIENGPEFKVVATNQLEAAVDASPAIVGDQIFLRSKSHLYCIGHSSESDASGTGVPQMNQNP